MRTGLDVDGSIRSTASQHSLECAGRANFTLLLKAIRSSLDEAGAARAAPVPITTS